MKIFNKMENFFEKYIEGFFNMKFSSGLEPVEVAKRLCSIMEQKKSVGISCIYVPNHYIVYLNADDHEKLGPYGTAIKQEIAGFLTAKASKRNYRIVGSIIIDLQVDETSGLGQFHVDCDFTEPIAEQQEVVVEDVSDTKVFAKPVMAMLQDDTCKFGIEGQLTVIDGLDAGKKVEVDGRRINIGRREGNELPLSDMNISRLHAYIITEGNRHVLYDAKSLNGTFVNDCQITKQQLSAGDHIKLGNTVLLYEVTTDAW